MNPEVELLFDYSSPFSYLANLQIEGFAKRNGAEVTYTPILLGAVLKATGNASPITVPAKGRYMATELRRWGARYGVAFKPNPHGFMSDTLRLMHGAVVYDDALAEVGLKVSQFSVLNAVASREDTRPAELAKFS